MERRSAASGSMAQECHFWPIRFGATTRFRWCTRLILQSKQLLRWWPTKPKRLIRLRAKDQVTGTSRMISGSEGAPAFVWLVGEAQLQGVLAYEPSSSPYVRAVVGPICKHCQMALSSNICAPPIQTTSPGSKMATSRERGYGRPSPAIPLP